MKNNTQSLSELHQRRGNLILLIIGVVLLFLFFLTLCSMPKKQEGPTVEPTTTGGGSTTVSLPGIGIGPDLTAPKFEPGNGVLSITPASISANSVVGKQSQVEIVLKAEKAPILLDTKSLQAGEKTPFELSGSCMEVGKDKLKNGEECTIIVSWLASTVEQLSDTLFLKWREDNSRVTLWQETKVPINVNITDSNPCVVCQCDKCEDKKPEKPREVKTLGGDDVDPPEVLPEGPWGEDSQGRPIIVEPKYVPLNLKNELMGTVAENQDVLDFKGEVIGRLLGDKTIVSPDMKVLGMAIPFVPAMKEDGEVIGNMIIDDETKSVRIVDAKGKVLGYPRVDSQVLDLEGQPIAFLAPWGLVINFNGDVLGGVYPTRDSSGKKYMLGVLNEKKQVVGFMRPMGLALNKKGEVIGGVAPSGVAVGAGCQAFGTVSMNGQVLDSYKQHIGRVLLDKAVVDNQGNELGSVVRQGVVIDSKGKVVAYVNSEGKALDSKGSMIGCVQPDGSVFAKEKFVGAVMPMGRVISNTQACGQVGSVYPDGQVTTLDLKNLGRILPDGTAVGEKNKTLGLVAPWGTAIAPDCQLLGLISLNGTVVSVQGSVMGCITRDKNVQDMKGNIIGMVTPTGIQVNDQNQVIGRVGLDGQIINGKGQIIGCVNSSKAPAPIMPNSTRGVVVNENGYPTGWSFVAGKTYDNSGSWKGDVAFNGWVIGDNHQITGVVPFSGAVFSDKGEIVARYNQMSGSVLDLSGTSVGRVLPNMTVINNTGTEILGVLIPEKTVFVDMKGQVLGTLQADGVLLHQGKDVPGKILANGSLLDENNKLKGARLRVGPVLNGAGKYIGSVTQSGDFINETGIQSGRALANGLVVNNQKQVLGMVFPSLSTAVSADGWLGSLTPQMIQDGEKKSYTGQVSDAKGNLLGQISAYGNVLGLDESIKGSLVAVAPFVTTTGSLMGWGNFNGGVNNPEGRSIASVLPSGLALNSAQQIQGMLVQQMAVVGTRGEYLGHTTSKGQLLSDKGEVLAITGMSHLIYDVQGVLLGQLLPPGIAIDFDGKLMGWTRYDGQIEDGTKVIGQVGLDGHVFDSTGQMIGSYFPVGMESFSGTNQSLGLVNEKGQVQNPQGNIVADVLTNPFVSDKALLKGRLITKSPMTASLNTAKTFGLLSPKGNNYALSSRNESGFAMINGYTVGSAGLVDGAILPIGSAISTTLGVLGQLYPDGSVISGGKKIASATGTGFVFSLAGELLGGIFSPGVIIDKKGKQVASTGATAAVMSNGKQVGSKMAFDSALTPTNNWLGNLMPRGMVVDTMSKKIGVVSLDGSVLNQDGTFVGRVLPDGAVAGVAQKSMYNTMPYIGHTVRQGLALGLKQEVLGRTSPAADILDKDNRKVGSIVDDGIIIKENGAPIGFTIPFVTAIGRGGVFLGTVSSDGAVVSLDNEAMGKVATNRTVKGAHELEVVGRLVPEELVVNNCKIVGQPAYDGRVINGQGAVVGRIQIDKKAIDAQGNEIGYIPSNGPLMGENGYLGRSLPDGRVVDINGVEIACVGPDDTVIDINTGEPIKGVKIMPPGIVLGPNGEAGRTTMLGTGIGSDGKSLGFVKPDGTFDGFPGYTYISPDIEVVYGADNKPKILLKPEGDGGVKGIDPKTGKEIFKRGPGGGIQVGKWTLPPGIEEKGFGVCEEIGYFTDCTWYNGETHAKIASLMPDGQLLDEDGNLWGFMSSTGEVSAPNGTMICRMSSFNMDLQQCGLPPEGEASSERKIKIGNQTYTVDENGYLIDDKNQIKGTLENGILYDLNRKQIDPTAPGGRVRPPEPEPIKIPQDQLDEIQQKMAQKRQSMRQGLGGKPLVMSAEMQAKFKPKKDKDWSSLGVGKSISTWPVDMSRVILQGRVIPAVLARSIDSRNSNSNALAIVETNIYAEEGRNILIPAGSQLIGVYSDGNSGSNGVAKVDISWNRLIRPDGVAFDLTGSPSGDAMGRGGIAAYLDRQLFQKYGNSLLGTIAESMFLQAYQMTSPDSDKMVSITTENGQQQQTMTEAQKTREEIRQLWLDQMEAISQELIAEFTQTPPVLYVPIGTRLSVILNQDLWLRSAEDDADDMAQEFGPESTEAQRPDMPSWEEKRKQQLNDMSDRRTAVHNANQPPKMSEKEQNQQLMETPLYDGSDRMQTEQLSDRVVQPPASTMN
jgi:type IV secretory pathway VirB10-like protein